MDTMIIIRMLARLMDFTGRITSWEASSSGLDHGSGVDTMAAATMVAGTADIMAGAATTDMAMATAGIMDAMGITGTKVTAVVAIKVVGITATATIKAVETVVEAATTTVAITVVETAMRFTAMQVPTVETAFTAAGNRTAVDMVAVDAGKAK
jgi:hypothetical protein